MLQHSRLVISAFFWFHRHPRRSILSGKLAPTSQSKNNKGAHLTLGRLCEYFGMCLKRKSRPRWLNKYCSKDIVKGLRW